MNPTIHSLILPSSFPHKLNLPIFSSIVGNCVSGLRIFKKCSGMPPQTAKTLGLPMAVPHPALSLSFQRRCIIPNCGYSHLFMLNGIILHGCEGPSDQPETNVNICSSSVVQSSLENAEVPSAYSFARFRIPLSGCYWRT